MAGRPLRPFIDDRLLAALDELLLTASATGHAAEARLRVAGSGASIDMSVTPFRADGQHSLLLRARRAEASAGDRQDLVGFIDQTPDAVVVTDSIGRVLWANPAFVALCEAPNEARLKGRDLADALGDDWQTWAALLARVRAHGIVGRRAVTLRLPGRAPVSTDVSAALLAEGDQERIGFTLRSTSLPAPPEDAARQLALDLNGLVTKLGKASLGELLAEAGRLAEQRLLQAALRVAGDRIDVAANLLRVSTDTLLLHMSEIGLPLPMPAGAEGQPPLVN
jgi:PAS domain-containing protein